jgi:hypothetical protein
MKRGKWTPDEDRFIVAFFDAVGPFIGPHDLQRSEAATIKRAAFLRECGAWAAYEEAQKANERALILSGHIPEFYDE